MSLNASDVKAIADVLRAVPKDDPPVVQAIWLAQVEAQFATCQPPITADLTKYK